MQYRLFIFLFFSSFLSTLFSQTIYLGELELEPEGTTRINSLKRFLDINQDEQWESEKELILFLEKKRQEMENLRIFDSIEINYSLSGSEDLLNADIHIRTIDRFTLVPLVYPDYDSNTGVSLGGHIIYPNSWGTLTHFETETSFSVQYENERWYISSWNLSPAISGIMWNGTENSIQLDQEFCELKRVAPDESLLKNYTYNATGISTETVFKISEKMSYSLMPSFYIYYNYEGTGIPNIPSEIMFEHRLMLGSINWMKNFRNGLVLDTGNSIDIIPTEDLKTLVDIDGSLNYYKTMGKRFNFYSRTGAFYSFNDEWDNTGEFIRGVEDNKMYGYTGFYQNLTLAIQFWRWPGVWDAQVHPFFDFGYSVPRRDPSPGFRYASGADFVLYLDRLKSLTARGTIGYDLSSDSNDWTDKLEIMISTSLFF